jgi:hypothetical protein
LLLLAPDIHNNALQFYFFLPSLLLCSRFSLHFLYFRIFFFFGNYTAFILKNLFGIGCDDNFLYFPSLLLIYLYWTISILRNTITNFIMQHFVYRCNNSASCRKWNKTTFQYSNKRRQVETYTTWWEIINIFDDDTLYILFLLLVR